MYITLAKIQIEIPQDCVFTLNETEQKTLTLNSKAYLVILEFKNFRESPKSQLWILFEKLTKVIKSYRNNYRYAEIHNI